MKSILEMIKKEKVEWKRLGEVCEVGTGNSNTNEQVENGKYNFYVRSKEVKKINKFDFNEEAIIIPGEGGIGDIYHYVNGKYALHQRAYRIKVLCNSINTKYIYYYLKNFFKSYILKKGVGSTVSSIRKPMIENYVLPIPSLETQEKIVKTLDKFTKYVTELQAELRSRENQYDYYRDMLMSEEWLGQEVGKLNKLLKLKENSIKYLEEELKFREKQFKYYKDNIMDSINELESEYNLKQTTLGEVGEFIRGNGLQKSDLQNDGRPVIHYGEIFTKYKFGIEKTISYTNEEMFLKLKKAKQNDILIATTSENIEDVGKAVVWLGKEEIGISGDMYIYRTNQNSKYMAYYFQTNEFRKQKGMRISGTKIIRLHSQELEKFKLFLPPLPIQKRVVKVLDKFQDLMQDTKGLLPKEIELMGKKYEYYREKLLTFNVESDTQHNTTQHNTTQHNTTQHNTTQHNTTQHNTTQHNTTQHNF